MDTVGKIPEFTTDGSPEPSPPEEVKQTVPEPTAEQAPEKDTPTPPVEKPADISGEEPVAPSIDPETARAVQGLQNERVKLLKEISELKGQKREIKQDQLNVVQAQIDELKDLHPEDVATIDRVLRAKGFMTKAEADKMFYDAVKNEAPHEYPSLLVYVSCRRNVLPPTWRGIPWVYCPCFVIVIVPVASICGDSGLMVVQLFQAGE